MWMKQQLGNFGEQSLNIPIIYDNVSTINLTNNLILHYRAKHIEVQYLLIRDYVNNGDINIYFVDSKHQLADIFTMVLDKSTLNLWEAALEYVIPLDCIVYHTFLPCNP